MMQVAAAAVITALTLTACSIDAPSQDTVRKLEQGFVTPPDEAKPRVWWHWLNANITDEGIKADLEWMSRVGIGGFTVFDANPGTPQIVKERLVYMTEPWKQTFRRMTKLADSLGMEMSIASSPGWSQTGGPWVKPEQAMKKIVWSRVDVRGGTTFSGKLPKPPSAPGKFQNSSSGGREDFYRDIAVLAFRLPYDSKSVGELSPKMTTSGSDLTLGDLTDGDINAEKPLRFDKDGTAWIQYEFDEPTSFCIVNEANSDYEYVDLEKSDDGIHFSKVVTIHDINRGFASRSGETFFEPVTARYFRLHFAPKPDYDKLDISEFNLTTAPRIHRYVEKAGFYPAGDLAFADTPALEKSLCIDSDKIVDLTSVMAADGSLEWTPEGEGVWRILRFGYSLTGKQNGPASAEATGLEVDKLEPEYVHDYISTYLDMYKDATDALMGSGGLQYINIDSWEAGCQNWTDRMMEYFKDCRGYDMLRYLPALAGYIVDSSATSDKFLWDFRKTIGQLIADNHYGTIYKELAARGMKSYTESHEGDRAFVGDGMEVKKNSDIPMGATWTPNDGTITRNTNCHEADVRESASVAHIYGQKFVAVESLTACGATAPPLPSVAWSWSPETLKPTADYEFANGANRFVLHSTVHQPDDDHLPGLSLGIFGQWFNRHETWAEAAGPWITYIARSSFMLQQGRAVEDILYFYGEDSNISSLFGDVALTDDILPGIPKGYSYDFVNPDALETVIDVKNSRITTPAGTQYSILVLDRNAGRMTMKSLLAIEKLVKKGMIVLGDRPQMSPSLADDEAEFEALAAKLWAGSRTGAKVGKGAVWSGRDIASVLDSCGDDPDCIFTGASVEADLNFVHRIADGIHIYWINSRNHGAEDAEVSFKVTGMKPEVWDPVTGKIADISYSVEGGRTVVPVHFDEFDSYFIVFREKTSVRSVEIPSASVTAVASIDAPWTVTFDGLGCSKTVQFPQLSAWNENEDCEIKYYSGSAVYSNHVTLSEDDLTKGGIWLNLGDVKNIAEVTVNGRYVGEVWRAPFRIDISDFVKAGENELSVKVTNLWVNRLIGDLQPGAEKYTYTTYPFYRATDPLRPSGLMGPVCVEAEPTKAHIDSVSDRPDAAGVVAAAASSSGSKIQESSMPQNL